MRCPRCDAPAAEIGHNPSFGERRMMCLRGHAWYEIIERKVGAAYGGEMGPHMMRRLSMAKKWIQSAIKRPGALTAKAKRAGMSPMSYARAHAHDSGLTGQQARAAINMQKKRKKRG